MFSKTFFLFVLVELNGTYTTKTCSNRQVKTWKQKNTANYLHM